MLRKLQIIWRGQAAAKSLIINHEWTRMDTNFTMKQTKCLAAGPTTFLRISWRNETLIANDSNGLGCCGGCSMDTNVSKELTYLQKVSYEKTL